MKIKCSELTEDIQERVKDVLYIKLLEASKVTDDDEPCHLFKALARIQSEHHSVSENASGVIKQNGDMEFVIMTVLGVLTVSIEVEDCGE